LYDFNFSVNRECARTPTDTYFDSAPRFTTGAAKKISKTLMRISFRFNCLCHIINNEHSCVLNYWLIKSKGNLKKLRTNKTKPIWNIITFWWGNHISQFIILPLFLLTLMCKTIRMGTAFILLIAPFYMLCIY
jgi:hypothetical protein